MPKHKPRLDGALAVPVDSAIRDLRNLHTSGGDRVEGSLSQRLTEATPSVALPAPGSLHRGRTVNVATQEDTERSEIGRTVKKTSIALLSVPLVASILLTACAGATKPNTSTSTITVSSPTSTTLTSATPTPSPAVNPNIPAAARAHTIAGAEAFVRYYIDQWNVAWAAPRAGILSPLCQASSKACAANEQTATRLAREGHRYDGNPVTIKFIGVLDATKHDQYQVLANLVQEHRNEIDKSGKIYLTDRREDFRVNVELMYTAHAWSVATMKTVK